MRIDEAIEQEVREAFSAVIGRDAADLKAALAKLGGPDFSTAVSYALYVIGYVALDVLDGELPEDGVAEMARDAVTGTKEWIDLGTPEAIAALITSAAKADVNVPGVPSEDVPGHAFVVGGYVLSRYRPDGKRWFEYLDDIWNAAVATDS
jgi:hypothetical protein